MLNDIDKKNPFKVPENYFQDFNTNIISKLPNKEPKKKVVPLWHAVTKWAAVAAVLAVVSIIGINYAEDNSAGGLDDHTTAIDDKLASLQSDYFLFLEDEANQSLYNEIFYLE